MSTDRIFLVQGDTPQVKVVVTDNVTEEPMDLSGAVVLMRFRAVGSTTLQALLTGTLLPGIERDDRLVSTGVYATPGRGGRVVFEFGATDLLCTPGDYEGEIEATLPDLRVITAYRPTRFRLREQFGAEVDPGDVSGLTELTIRGLITSTAGGFRFPDNSIQQTAFNGTAAEVSIADAGSKFAAGNVEEALQEVAGTAQSLVDAITSQDWGLITGIPDAADDFGALT